MKKNNVISKIHWISLGRKYSMKENWRDKHIQEKKVNVSAFNFSVND